jgi:hypothetical protein
LEALAAEMVTNPQGRGIIKAVVEIDIVQHGKKKAKDEKTDLRRRRFGRSQLSLLMFMMRAKVLLKVFLLVGYLIQVREEDLS